MTEKLIVKDISDRVMVIALNRPEALNALSHDLISHLNQALSEAEANPEIGAIVLMGNGKAFAAGADIREMKDLTYADVYKNDFVEAWEHLAKCRKPIVAAVSGYALGGGCELVMMCDIIFADDTARFGQPEITLGTIPGGGGTQRLTQLIGKAKAMEMCLTGRLMDASEAERCGLVTRVVPKDRLKEEAVAVAKKIATFSQPIVQMVKEAIRASENMPLDQGIRFERRLFQATFSLKDRQEGMNAFLEKRKAVFKHE
ncbi:MAG: enoyl-CoA hydratase/isomerase family protein [Alphaproteobacteria bacterium]|jgi:enoyl-CoA hydratase|nr:enoyl-CoA hydratase/isomerase family protein [Alphaproteobacteria bacterium]